MRSRRGWFAINQSVNDDARLASRIGQHVGRDDDARAGPWQRQTLIIRTVCGRHTAPTGVPRRNKLSRDCSVTLEKSKSGAPAAPTSWPNSPTSCAIVTIIPARINLGHWRLAGPVSRCNVTLLRPCNRQVYRQRDPEERGVFLNALSAPISSSISPRVHGVLILANIYSFALEICVICT